MKEITLKEWSAYLPYGLICEVKDQGGIETDTLFGVYDNKELVFHNIVESHQGFESVKPILYDLSWLTREITHKGESFIPIEKFEIGDDDSGIEYDHGNIRLIKDLESISKYNSYHDIQFLPFEVVQRLIEWHFNVFNLPDELIVRVSEDFNPYK